MASLANQVQRTTNWTEFTKAILLRFGPTDYEDPSEALTRLKQTFSVTEYQEIFEKLSHQIDGLPETFLIRYFIAGLRDEIRLDVKIKQPRTLAGAIVVMQQPIPNISAGILGPPPKANQTANATTPIQWLTN